jgi:hypothetical protein
MIYDPEHLTRGRLNAYCSSHATSDDRKSDSRGEEVVNNYEICTARRLGRYEERDVGDMEPAPDTHNTNTDDRTITTGQIHELINEKVLVKAQPTSDAAVGITAKFIHPYEGPYIITRVIPPSTYGISTTNEKIRGEFNKKSSEALP